METGLGYFIILKYINIYFYIFVYFSALFSSNFIFQHYFHIFTTKLDTPYFRYHLVAADFADVPRLREKLEESEVDYNCPTLVLAECALVYADSTKVGCNFSLTLSVEIRKRERERESAKASL